MKIPKWLYFENEQPIQELLDELDLETIRHKPTRDMLNKLYDDEDNEELNKKVEDDLYGDLK